MRSLTYAAAINEAHSQSMELDRSVMVMGQLVDSEAGVFGTTLGLQEKFGSNRVQDFPVSEAVMTSAALGAALAGMRPVVVHHRLDFMLYSMDPIVNWLALWRFKSNKETDLPVTIRTIVGRGWGQGPQHSKSLHAWFAHVPGLTVAMPATPFDAKGILLESIFNENPTIIIENRSLYSMTDYVPEVAYRVRFGQAATRREGKDLTIVAIGVMVPIALRAATILQNESIEIEVIDVRTVSPLDNETLLNSVSKTKRLLVADPAWEFSGIAAEIVSMVCSELSTDLLTNPVRVCLPNSHTPMSSSLETEYYPDENILVNKIRAMMSLTK